MNDSHSDFLSLPLWRRVLHTGWKGASCVGLHSGAWLFLELLCESIWTVMLRRCPQWLTCRWAAPLEPRVVVALQLLHLATGASIFTWRLARWGIEGPGAEVSWDSLASSLLWSIKSGQPLAVLNALGSSWSLSHCLPCGDTSVRVFLIEQSNMKLISWVSWYEAHWCYNSNLRFFTSAFDPTSFQEVFFSRIQSALECMCMCLCLFLSFIYKIHHVSIHQISCT